MFTQGRIRVIGLVVADLLCVAAAWAAAAVGYWSLGNFLRTHGWPDCSWGGYELVEYLRFAPIAFVFVGVNAALNLYHGNWMYPSAPSSPVEEFRRLCISSFLTHAGAIAYMAFVYQSMDGRISRAVCVYACVLTAVGALLAKLAKADGHVDASEIAAAERAFVRLGLTPGNRAICIQAFRAAKADSHSIFDYAESFAAVARGEPLRQLMYDLLWDVACADGEVSADERRILEMIVTPLRIRPSLFAEQRARRLGGRAGARRRTPSGAPSPYEILGCAPTATDDEVRRAYRAQAKKHHPDLLRAQGLPEEMVARATAQMARINAAWEEIKRARSL